MPNGRWEPFDANEYRAFVGWMQKQYGFWRGQIVTKGAYKSFPEYQEWVQLGKPSGELPTGEYVKYPEAPWWGMEPAEREEKLYDLSAEPYPATEGYHWEISRYDENQRPTRPYWDLVPDEGGYGDLSPLEQSQIERWEREFELGKSQWEREFEWRRAQATEAGITPEETYAEYRQRMLYELTGPRDWITKWQLMHMPTGKLPRDEGYAPSMEAAREKGLTHWYPEVTTGIPSEEYVSPLAGMSEAYRKRQGWIGWEGKPEDWGQADIMQKAKEGIDAWIAVREMTLGRPLTEEEKLERALDFYEAQVPAKKVRGGEARPKAPPAPAWLPQFVPGLAAGQPIEKLPMKTPSGQMWAMQPPSVQLGLAGYADWAQERPFEDIYEHKQMMKPRTPRGAGAEQWRPAYQR